MDLPGLSLFALECLNDSKSILPSRLSGSTFNTESTAVVPSLLSELERTMYYNGISPDPPELLYRSDLLQNPFPVPKGRHHHIPTKTVYGVFNTPLNHVWDTVAPQIRDYLRAQKIRYSAIMAARFVSHGEDGKDTLGPIVIWIATHPLSTTEENALDASSYILKLLESKGVEGVVVEWYEGVVEKLLGPPLLPVTAGADPTHYVSRFLTTALGMPIAAAEHGASDAQGSLAFFFHENKDKHGSASARVFGVSNCHVLRQDVNTDYEFRGAGAPRRHVRLAGLRRFQRGLDEIKANIADNASQAEFLAKDLTNLLTEPQSGDQADINIDIEENQRMLAKVKNDIVRLENFYKSTMSQWGDISRRNIGHVDWAPMISVDILDHSYTKDIATFELDAARFRDNFKGNVVDLGDKYTVKQLTRMFYPQSTGRTTFKYPPRRQLRIKDCLPRELLAVPDCVDVNGESCLIVMKDGNTTDLTVGRYSGLEAYISRDGIESIELAIYNYDKKSGPFSEKGDSGSLIFDGEGHMVGILHSGMYKGVTSHVTYAIPAWWAIKQLKLKYPHADFNRTEF